MIPPIDNNKIPPTSPEPPPSEVAKTTELTFSERVSKAAETDQIPLNQEELEQVIETAGKVGDTATKKLLSFGKSGVDVLFLGPQEILFLGKTLGEGSFSKAREATHVTANTTTQKTDIVFKHSKIEIAETCRREEVIQNDKNKRAEISEKLSEKGIENDFMPLVRVVYRFEASQDEPLFGFIDRRFDGNLTKLTPANTNSKTPRQDNENLKLCSNLFSKTDKLKNIQMRHGDIKEQNLFILGKNVYLADLDGAKSMDEIKEYFDTNRNFLLEEKIENLENILGNENIPQIPDKTSLEEKCKILEKAVDKTFEEYLNEDFADEISNILNLDTGDLNIANCKNIEEILNLYIIFFKKNNMDFFLTMKKIKGLNEKSDDDIKNILKMGFYKFFYENKLEEDRFNFVFNSSAKSENYINLDLVDTAKEAFIKGDWNSYQQAEYESDVYATGLTIIQHLCGYSAYRTISADPKRAEIGCNLLIAPEDISPEKYQEGYHEPIEKAGFRATVENLVNFYEEIKSNLKDEIKEYFEPIVEKIKRGIEKLDLPSISVDEKVEIHNDIIFSIEENIELFNEMGEIGIKQKLEKLGFNENDVKTILSSVARDPDKIPTAQEALKQLNLP